MIDFRELANYLETLNGQGITFSSIRVYPDRVYFSCYTEWQELVSVTTWVQLDHVRDPLHLLKLKAQKMRSELMGRLLRGVDQ